MFLVGLACRDRSQEEFRSTMSITAGRIGITLGVICALCFEIIPSLYALFGGGVIPAIFVTTLGMLIPNKFLKDQTWKKKKIAKENN